MEEYLMSRIWGTLRQAAIAFAITTSLVPMNSPILAQDSEAAGSSSGAQRASQADPARSKALPKPTPMEYTGERSGNGRVVRVHFGNDHQYVVVTPNGQGGYDVTPFSG
jgi:hypothetical protein